MTDHYVELREARDAAVPNFPPLLSLGQIEMERMIAESASDRDHTRQLASELSTWRKNDIAFTAAHEILSSEVKFRAILWSISTIREWRRTGELLLGSRRLPVSVLRDAETLAHDVNAFLFHYETGNYPARQTLVLLHRSLAVVSKVTEPVVWERSLNARWGRRVLRIGLAAQHFNDVTPIHSSSDLTWSPGNAQIRMIHPRVRRSVLGMSFVVPDSPLTPRLLPGPRLRLRGYYWYVVGLLSPAPKLSFVSYGGSRLRQHRRRENELAGLLKLAIDSARDALDVSWSFDELKKEQRDQAQERRAEYGSLTWLWLPRNQRPDAGDE